MPVELFPWMAMEPLLLIPNIGQPLYDLLEPDTRILVNLGYGSITEGWNQGPANVPTTFGAYHDIDQTKLSDALSNGWQQGLTDALHDLQSPVSYQDQVAPLLPFAESLYTTGYAPDDPSFFAPAADPCGAPAPQHAPPGRDEPRDRHCRRCS